MFELKPGKILATASLGLFGVNLLDLPAEQLVRRRPRPILARRKKNNYGEQGERNGRANKQYRLKGIRP